MKIWISDQKTDFNFIWNGKIIILNFKNPPKLHILVKKLFDINIQVCQLPQFVGAWDVIKNIGKGHIFHSCNSYLNRVSIHHTASLPMYLLRFISDSRARTDLCKHAGQLTSRSAHQPVSQLVSQVKRRFISARPHA